MVFENHGTEIVGFVKLILNARRFGFCIGMALFKQVVYPIFAFKKCVFDPAAAAKPPKHPTTKHHLLCCLNWIINIEYVNMYM